MIVVSDTTAVSNLVQIGHLELLKKIYSRIIIPKGVHDELLVLDKLEIPIQEILKSDWIEVRKVESEVLLKKFSTELDLGEAEAIALAIELKAEYLLIDEKLGRRIAKENHIPIIGTLGILLKGRELGLIKNMRGQMDDLRKVGFWISDGLYDKILDLEKRI